MQNLIGFIPKLFDYIKYFVTSAGAEQRRLSKGQYFLMEALHLLTFEGGRYNGKVQGKALP